MKDVLGNTIQAGDRLAVAGRLGSCGAQLYLATVEGVGQKQVGYGKYAYIKEVLTLRLESCGRLQETEGPGRMVVIGRRGDVGATLAVYLDGAVAPAYTTSRPARIFISQPEKWLYELEVPGGETETTEAQAEG